MEGREGRGARDGSHLVRKKAALPRQGQPMDEMPGVAREPIKDLKDERGDHVPAPQRVLVRRLLECWGRPYDGRKQTRLRVRKSKCGTNSREGGTAGRDGADDFELAELMVLCGGFELEQLMVLCGGGFFEIPTFVWTLSINPHVLPCR
eukprot:818040-Pleurochrysis_carterae.AAC.2